MSQNIFNEDYLSEIQQLHALGYARAVNTSLNRVEHEGRIWTREAAYSKQVKGWDRFVLFLKTLFEKIAVWLKLRTLSENELADLNDRWSMSLGKVSLKNVYSDTLKEITEKTFQFLFSSTPSIEIDDIDFRITPKVSGLEISLLSSSNEGCEQLKNQLGQLGLEYVESDADNRKLFLVSRENMSRFSVGIGSLNTLLPNNTIALELFEALGTHVIAHHLIDRTSRPDMEGTIALTLAHLERHLHSKIAHRFLRGISPEDGANILRDRTINGISAQIQAALPIVSFDDFGMKIKLPEGCEVLRERLKNEFEISSKSNYSIDNGNAYTFEAVVPRDRLEAFLEQLGLKNIPPEIHPDYAEGKTYYEYAVISSLVHPYTPDQSADPLQAINLSISTIIPNELLIEQPDGDFLSTSVVPSCVVHPSGRLLVRLPKTEDHSDTSFKNRLQGFLERSLEKTIQIQPIDFLSGDQEYDDALVINEADVGRFLKVLKLTREHCGRNISELIALENEFDGFTPQFVHNSQGHLDVMGTVAKTLLKLAPSVDYQTPQPNVEARFNELVIRIPSELAQQRKTVGAQGEIPFGEYLAHLFSLHGRADRTGQFQISVPKANIRGFFVRDLKLRELPQQNPRSTHASFYQAFLNSFGRRVGIESSPYGTIVGWRLRNPTFVVPSNVPYMSDDEIKRAARDVLNGHQNVEQYCNVIGETLRRKNLLEEESQVLLVKYLTLLVRPTPEVSSQAPLERRRNALITIGASATDCMPGRFTKIQTEFLAAFVPGSDDPLRTMLLAKIEEFKLFVLAQIFRSVGIGRMDVHEVAGAMAVWGDELGLNAEAGRRDSYQRFDVATEGKKQEFKQRCQEGLVSYLFDQLSTARVNDEMGRPTSQLEHVYLYQERLTQILTEDGLSETDIEGEYDEDLSVPIGGEMDRLLPRVVDSDGNPTEDRRLTREALEKILISIGVLQG